VTIKLPERVPAGLHDLVVVLDEKESGKNPVKSNAEELMQFAGTVCDMRLEPPLPIPSVAQPRSRAQ